MFPCFNFPVGHQEDRTYAIMTGSMFTSIEGEWRKSSEFIYSHQEDFNKYKHSNILLVAGGPTANSIDWQASEYDYVWSLNQYYKNNKLFNTNIDLITVSGETKLDNNRFKEHLEKSNPWVGFESHHRWLRGPHEIPNFQKTHSKVFAYASRFYGKIGGGIRLLILGAALKANKISFVGLDGPEPILKGNHAFEPGKTNLPSQVNANNAEKVFTHQYDTFWQYMKDTFPETEYNSLDKTNKYHQEIL